MTVEVSERKFEAPIECALLQHAPDACPGDSTAVRESAAPYGEEPIPGGYRKRRPEDYDRGLCLIPKDVIDFLLATQPKEWDKLEQHHGADLKERFLGRLSREIGRRGALDVLRNGIKDSGCKFRLAYFPARERAQRGAPAAARGESLRGGAASSATARTASRAWIWHSSSTGFRSSRRSSRTR